MHSILLTLVSATLAVCTLAFRFLYASSVKFAARNQHRFEDFREEKDRQLPGYQSTRIAGHGQKLQCKDDSNSKTSLYKDLFFKVQNLEYHADVLPKARQTLFELLREGLNIERSKWRKSSILDLKSYNAHSLQAFLIAEHDCVTSEWEEYNNRRARGGLPELFCSRQSAAQWVKKLAPVKLLDGAWLGHIHKITTPFALREVTKDAWQVLSEELGDGDLRKNHVFLYAKLLKEVGVILPSSHDVDFTHPRHDMGDDLIWKASAAQLLISLFPHEVLPEILGFNLHYELLTLETLKAVKELPEFGISSYYFALHVSIDNADSGHAAMALKTVTRYLDIVQKQDPALVPETWRRIQAGYILSKSAGERRVLSYRERCVVQMLRLKADASHQIHCASKVKIGGQTLAQWLSPNTWTESDECRRRLLQALSDAKPWIVKGNSAKSLLMRELSWNGRMFGAFTNKEVEHFRAWIDELDGDHIDHESQYWDAIQPREPRHGVDAARPFPQDVMTHHPVFQPQPQLDSPLSRPSFLMQNWSRSFELGPIGIPDASFDALLPLWFVHPCLLENMVSSPYRTATSLVSHMIRALRAESGYLEEGLGVAGMDEQNCSEDGPSLISLGLEMSERLGQALPASIRDVIDAGTGKTVQATDFSKALLSLALRPIQNETLLLGLALAFVDLEVGVAQNDSLLSVESQRALQQIVFRKRAAFQDCLDELKKNESKHRECLQYYTVARIQITNALVAGRGLDGVGPGLCRT